MSHAELDSCLSALHKLRGRKSAPSSRDTNTTTKRVISKRQKRQKKG